MKKLFWITNLGWLLGISILITNATCNSNGSTDQTTTVCTTCSSDQFFGLDAQALMKGIARYRAYQYKNINSNLSRYLKEGNEDARSCWYSLDTLKKFICLIENYSNSPNLQLKSNKLGIRFYYAAYDSAQDLPMQGFKLAGGSGDGIIHHSLAMRHTLFMVPTVSDSGLNIDFDPRYSSKSGVEPNQTPVGEPSPPLSLNISKLAIWNEFIDDSLSQPLVLDGSTANNKSRIFIVGGKPLYTQPAIPSGKNQGNLCPPTCSNGARALLDQVDAKWPDGTITP